MMASRLLNFKTFCSPCASCQGCSVKNKVEETEGENYLVILPDGNIEISRDYTTLIKQAKYKTKANFGKPIHAKHCSDRIRSFIKEKKIKHVFCIGISAIKSVIMRANTDKRVNPKTDKFFGAIIPDRELKAFIHCLPEYTMIHRNILSVSTKFYRNNTDTEIKDLECIVCPTTELAEAVLHVSKAINSNHPVYIDYETTGLKPHNKGHEIVTASICYYNAIDKKIACAFPFFKDKEFRNLWKQLLNCKPIVAHNLSFEMTWTYFCGALTEDKRYYPSKFHWDTMLAEHCIDNNAATGLKHAAYKHVGVQWQDAGIDLEAETSNSFNALKTIEPNKIYNLLVYNCYDTLHGMHLYEWQKEWFSLHSHCLEGFKLFMQGAYELAKVSIQGIHTDIAAMDSLQREAMQKQNRALRSIYSHPDVVELGVKDINRRTELATLMRHLGAEDIDFDNEDIKQDKHVMAKLKHPVFAALLEYKRWNKVTSTYLNQFRNEVDENGIIHPDFNLNKVVTFRSSSSNPNFQNIPKRDPEVYNAIRSLLKPRQGNCLMEFDYKAVEVAMSCCYHNDPAMINYVSSPGTDMHRDIAATLFNKEPKDINKKERQWAKNLFVFPQFYGAGSDSCAHNLWEVLNTDLPETKQHLIDTGIIPKEAYKQYDVWEKWIDDKQNHFWKVRFSHYDKWKNQMYKNYEKTGIIKLHSGFECRGYVSFTKATNRPIQGSAFHALLFTLIKSAPIIREISGRSNIIGQIHDSLVGDIHPEEVDEVCKIINNYGTDIIRRKWKWINVPLVIEVEKGEVDGAWTTLKEYKPAY